MIEPEGQVSLKMPSFRKSGCSQYTVGTVPTFKMHNVGTVPTSKMHNVGTVPTFKMHNVGTVPTNKTHNIGTELSYATLRTKTQK